MSSIRGLKDRGKTTELVFYPREGHGLTEYFINSIGSVVSSTGLPNTWNAGDRPASSLL